MKRTTATAAGLLAASAGLFAFAIHEATPFGGGQLPAAFAAIVAFGCLVAGIMLILKRK